MGRALSAELGRRGATILGFDADAQTLKESSQVLIEQQIEHHFQMVDITNQKAVTRALLQGIAKEKQIDGLILNAGITRIRPFSETDFDEFVKVINVNLFGAVIFAKLLLSKLRQSKGIVVGISSVAGFAPLKNRTAYSASKHGLSAFLETLRSEEDDLDVLLVYPSFLSHGIKSRSIEAGQVPPQPKSGLKADMAAAKIADAIVRRKKRLYLPFQSRLARLVWSFWPDLYLQLMKRKAEPS